MLDQETITLLFPFLVRLDSDLNVLQVGRSLQNRINLKDGDHIRDHFTVLRPFGELTPEKIVRNQNRLTLLKLNESGLQLRGQLVHVQQPDEFLFIGSLKINTMEDVEQHKLNIGDFAAHDPILDFLFLLNLSGSSQSEAQEVIDDLRLQNSIYQTAVDNARDYIFVINQENRFVYQNRPLQLMLGTLGISQPHVSETCPSHVLEKITADLKGVIDGQAINDHLLTLRRANGTEIELKGCLKPFNIEKLEPMAIGYFTSSHQPAMEGGDV